MLKSIAIGYAVFYPYILMLPGVVSMGFHNAYCGKASIVEGFMMPATTKPVQAVYHHGVHFRHVLRCGFVYIARQLSGYSVYFATVVAPHLAFAFGFGGRHRFREDAEGTVVNNAVYAFYVSNHVVVKHSDNLPVVFLGIFCQSGTAKKALFFSGKSYIHNAVFKRVAA